MSESTLSTLSAAWRTRADELERFAAPAAVAFREAAAELEAAQRAAAGEVLTLAAAARVSGYAAETIRHKVATGEIQNVGKKGSPRVRVGDLPRKVRQNVRSNYNPAADALRLARSTSDRVPGGG